MVTCKSVIASAPAREALTFVGSMFDLLGKALTIEYFSGKWWLLDRCAVADQSIICFVNRIRFQFTHKEDT